MMNRIKSVYRSWAIPCAGTSVYSRRHRAAWLVKLVEPGVRTRAEHLYQQLDSLEPVRQAARRELLRESRKHAAVKLLRQIPAIGPIRSALLVALLQTPHRFRRTEQAPEGWPNVIDAFLSLCAVFFTGHKSDPQAQTYH